jgi:hypothetical protein
MANANMPSVINQPYTCRVKIYRNAHEGGRKGGREGGGGLKQKLRRKI